MRILLVDDDPSVIQSLLPSLRSIPGHEVRVATNGGKALENAESLGGVDVLITDVVMEPMDGFTLQTQLAERYPRMRTIFISGYDLADYAEQIGGQQTLEKPIDPAILLMAVQKELAVRVAPLPVPAANAGAAPPAIGQPRAVAAPVAGTPRAAAPGIPRVGTVPQARAAATTPMRAVGAKTAPVTPISPSVVGKPGELTGQTIGAYNVKGQLGEDEWGPIYAAVQGSIKRPVILHLLNAARGSDAVGKLRFIGDARAKAQVQHPSILSVYEAGESGGHIFYASEFAEGQTLAQLAVDGRKIDEKAAFNVLRTAADGFACLRTNHIPHPPVDGSSIYVGHDGQARLANLATQAAETEPAEMDEIIAVGRALFGVVHTGPGFSPTLRGLLSRMVQPVTTGLRTWDDVLEAVRAIQPKHNPAAVAAISAQERAAAAALEAARKQQRRELTRNIVSVITLILLGAGIVWYTLRNRAHVGEKMIHIPAGSYIVGQKKVTLSEFWIDEHEVTVGQYANFLAALEAMLPSKSKDFDHPAQPKTVEHQPKHWAIFYGQAQAGGAVHSAPYKLDSPMVEITWWDAYAYARWKGHYLPTEEQWEAAARGPEGFLYPWGNEFDPKKVNSGADFIANDPGAKGKVDHWNFWNPVDAVRGDRSPFGVVGMAGNVAEWVNGGTSGKPVAVIKGGSFKSLDVKLTNRVTDHDPTQGEEHVGFRTVTMTKPPTAQ
jgi:formylglycine-generating enzyme required for sulfatase activity/CheY-like chemotaxis protein